MPKRFSRARGEVRPNLGHTILRFSGKSVYGPFLDFHLRQTKLSHTRALARGMNKNAPAGSARRKALELPKYEPETPDTLD